MSIDHDPDQMILHCKAVGPETTWAYEMNFVGNHAPGAGSLDRPVGQQSSALPLYHGCLQPRSRSSTILFPNSQNSTLARTLNLHFPYLVIPSKDTPCRYVTLFHHIIILLSLTYCPLQISYILHKFTISVSPITDFISFTPFT